MSNSDSFASTRAMKPPAIEAADLPSFHSTDLKLEPATLLEYVQCTYLNADEWKGPLTIEQYLEREDILQAVDLTRDGRITGWVLTSDTLPQSPDRARTILGSCESILLHAYVAKEGAVKVVQAHGIASVFNRKEYRGRGYASRMMADLGKRLETWQSVESTTNQFSVLFSDIGQTFYAKHGWEVFASTHVHLEAVDQSSYSTSKSALPTVTDLSVEHLIHIPTVKYFEDRLCQESNANPGRTYVGIRPDMEHFEWHFARDEFQSRLVGKNFPKLKGAIHRATGLALIWCRVYATKKSEWQLDILHIVIPPSVEKSADTVDAMSALLLRAQFEAHDWEMSAGVEVWDPSDLVVAAAQQLKTKEHDKVEIITRDKEHICSLRLPTGTHEQVEWLAKEKYGWC